MLNSMLRLCMRDRKRTDVKFVIIVLLPRMIIQLTSNSKVHQRPEIHPPISQNLYKTSSCISFKIYLHLRITLNMLEGCPTVSLVSSLHQKGIFKEVSLNIHKIKIAVIYSYFHYPSPMKLTVNYSYFYIVVKIFSKLLENIDI